MIKNLFVIGAVSIAVVACNSKEANETADSKQDKKEKKELVAKVPVNANRTLVVELEGMVCQMGCGGSIRKELNKTEAVGNCEFNFEDERAVDVARIDFDKEKISADEIVEIIKKTNDGQFKVHKVTSEDLAEVQITEKPAKSKRKEGSKMKVSVSSASAPNIFDWLSGLVSI